MALKKVILNANASLVIDRHRCGYLSLSRVKAIQETIDPDWVRVILAGLRETEAPYVTEKDVIGIINELTDHPSGHIRRTLRHDALKILKVCDQYITEAAYGTWHSILSVMVAKLLIARGCIAMEISKKSDPASIKFVENPIRPMFASKDSGVVTVIDQVVLAEPITTSLAKFEEEVRRVKTKSGVTFVGKEFASDTISLITTDVRNALGDWADAINEARKVLDKCVEHALPLVLAALVPDSVDHPELLKARNRVGKYANAFILNSISATDVGAMASTEINANALILLTDLMDMFESALSSKMCPCEVTNDRSLQKTLTNRPIGEPDPLTHMQTRVTGFAGDDVGTLTTLVARPWTDETATWSTITADKTPTNKATSQDPASCLNLIVSTLDSTIKEHWIFSKSSPLLAQSQEGEIDQLSVNFYTAECANAILLICAMMLADDYFLKSDGDDGKLQMHFLYFKQRMEGTSGAATYETTEAVDPKDVILARLPIQNEGESLFKKPSLVSVLGNDVFAGSVSTVKSSMPSHTDLKIIADQGDSTGSVTDGIASALTIPVYSAYNHETPDVEIPHETRDVLPGIEHATRATYMIETTPGVNAAQQRLATYLDTLTNATHSNAAEAAQLQLIRSLYKVVPAKLRDVVARDLWSCSVTSALNPDDFTAQAEKVLLSFNQIMAISTLLDVVGLSSLAVSLKSFVQHVYKNIDASLIAVQIEGVR